MKSAGYVRFCIMKVSLKVQKRSFVFKTLNANLGYSVLVSAKFSQAAREGLLSSFQSVSRLL